MHMAMAMHGLAVTCVECGYQNWYNICDML